MFGDVVNLDELKDLSNIISPVIAIYAFLRTIKSNQVNKLVDVSVECHRRFEALTKEKYEIISYMNQSDANNYIVSWSERFFSLQFDEYIWYRLGYIKKQVFRYWMESRYRDFVVAKGAHDSGIESFEKIVFFDRWEIIKKHWVRDHKHDFIEFMEKIRNNQIQDALKRYYFF